MCTAMAKIYHRTMTPEERRTKSVRSLAGLAATQRSGAGAHGGTKRDRNRRDRKSCRLSLRG